MYIFTFYCSLVKKFLEILVAYAILFYQIDLNHARVKMLVTPCILILVPVCTEGHRDLWVILKVLIFSRCCWPNLNPAYNNFFSTFDLIIDSIIENSIFMSSPFIYGKLSLGSYFKKVAYRKHKLFC